MLHRRHHIGFGQDDDFTVRSLSEIAQASESASEVMTLLLAAVLRDHVFGVKLGVTPQGQLLLDEVGLIFAELRTDVTEDGQRILDAAGYQCLTTSHALEALRRLGSEHPDLYSAKV